MVVRHGRARARARAHDRERVRVHVREIRFAESVGLMLNKGETRRFVSLSRIKMSDELFFDIDKTKKKLRFVVILVYFIYVELRWEKRVLDHRSIDWSLENFKQKDDDRECTLTTKNDKIVG